MPNIPIVADDYEVVDYERPTRFMYINEFNSDACPTDVLYEYGLIVDIYGSKISKTVPNYKFPIYQPEKQQAIINIYRQSAPLINTYYKTRKVYFSKIDRLLRASAAYIIHNPVKRLLGDVFEFTTQPAGPHTGALYTPYLYRVSDTELTYVIYTGSDAIYARFIAEPEYVTYAVYALIYITYTNGKFVNYANREIHWPLSVESFTAFEAELQHISKTYINMLHAELTQMELENNALENEIIAFL